MEAKPPDKVTCPACGTDELESKSARYSAMWRCLRCGKIFGYTGTPGPQEAARDAQVQRLKARGFVTEWHEGLLQIGWKVETVTPEDGGEPLAVFTDGAAVVEYPGGWVVRWNTRRADRPFHETSSLEAAVDLVLSIYEGAVRD